MRVERWPALLAEWEAMARARPFVWGAWDCCLAAGDWIAMARGFDPASWFRGRYATAAGADAAMRAFAGGGLVETTAKIAARHGFPELPAVLQAQRGDVALTQTPLGPALGVVLGARVGHVGERGLMNLPLRRALKAWRV